MLSLLINMKCEILFADKIMLFFDNLINVGAIFNFFSYFYGEKLSTEFLSEEDNYV